MNELNIENKTGTMDEKYETGLEAFWNRDCTTAIANLEDVLDLYPRHPYAQEYITECKRAIEAGEVSEDSFDPMLIGIVVVIMIAAGAIFLFIKKNKPKDATSKALSQKTTEKSATKEKVNFCPHCGEDIESGEKFCPKCGKKL